MIEIFAVVRPVKAAQTKKKLKEIGHPAFTCVKVNGKGKIPQEQTLPDGSKLVTGLVNKRLFIIEAKDEEEDMIIKALMEVNSTGRPGDGKIFIVKLQSAYNIREGFCKKQIG